MTGKEGGRVFCPNCRQAVAEGAVCPYCGAPLRRRRSGRKAPDGGSGDPLRRNRRPPEISPDEIGIPLALQDRKDDPSVRAIRRAPERRERRTDAKPAETRPRVYPNSHSRLIRAILAFVLLSFSILAGAAYVLLATENGQRMMAQWQWDIAPTSAYAMLGKDLLNQGFYREAETMLQIALEREPDNVDALIDMAQVQTETGNLEEAIRIYESLVYEIAPEHPGAYRNLIRIYQEQGLNAEALALMQAASSKTGRQEFGIMLRENTPSAPILSKQAGRYNETIDVTITIPQGETVYYTTDGTDPSEAGQVYEKGRVIHVDEGRLTVKAIGFTENGVPSEQVEATYTVIIPTPAAPKANYASGKYKKAPKVSLRPGDEDKKKNEEIIAIYYTLDGRQATTQSTLYTGPIQLPTGDCELRAISVAKNGKVSYEMRVTYSVEGNLKRKFSVDDTFRNLALFRTTYTGFVKTYGTPDSYDALSAEEGYDPALESYEAQYSWGTARFVVRSANAQPVLYALDTRSEKMTGPRSTRVGMRGTEVMDKFQDLGHPALDDDGNRLLYNYNSGGYMFGSYRKEGDGQYAIHYYTPVDENHTIFIELTYYLSASGKVSRILWQRYIAQVMVN